VTKELDATEKALVLELEELTLEVNAYVKGLAKIEEPLLRMFITETIKITNGNTSKGADNAKKTQDVTLAHRLTQFREEKEEKETALRQLWEEWETIQFELISLGAEVCGQDAIVLTKEQREDMKIGQPEKLDNAFGLARVHGAAMETKRTEANEALRSLEDEMTNISSQTKQTISEMQEVSSVIFPPILLNANDVLQQYNMRKNKLFKGLHRHIQLLAAL
jgi:chromosome segregation ATPase